MSPKWPNKMDNDDSESGKKGEPMDSPFFYKPILIFFFWRFVKANQKVA
jgi:hypothetical protein